MAIIRKKDQVGEVRKTTGLVHKGQDTSETTQLSQGLNSLLDYNTRYLFDYDTNFADSLNVVNNRNGNISHDPRVAAKELLFTVAIERIAKGVVSLPWVIDSNKPISTESDVEIAKNLTKALKHPNNEWHNTYTKVVKAIVKDLLIEGVACVERKPTDSSFIKTNPKTQPFWYWAVFPRDIHLNKEWKPHLANLHPRYYFIDRQKSLETGKTVKIPLYDKDLFLIQERTDSSTLIPDSPVVTAWKQLNRWVKMDRGQGNVVENPVRNYLIGLESGGVETIGAFKEWWGTEAINSPYPPVLKGKINVQKIAAEKDDELYPKYTEYIISLIALSFSLTKKEYNLTDHDNRATSEASADSTFQNAILPIADTIIDHFNTELVEYYTDCEFTLKLGELENRKEETEATIVTTLYEKNVATKNEMRKRIGLDAIENGDIFSIEEQQGHKQEEEDPNTDLPSRNEIQDKGDKKGEKVQDKALKEEDKKEEKSDSTTKNKEKNKEKEEKVQASKLSPQLSLFDL